jgi:hypothetical protein
MTGERSGVTGAPSAVAGRLEMRLSRRQPKRVPSDEAGDGDGVRAAGSMLTWLSELTSDELRLGLGRPGGDEAPG